MSSRAAIESELRIRVGAMLTAAGLAVQGERSSLVPSVAWAMRQVGAAMADPLMPTDAEIAGVGASLLDKLLDYAELRALEIAAQNFTAVGTNVQGQGTEPNELRTGIERALARKANYNQLQYGASAPSLSGGTINLGFQEVKDA